MSQSVNQFDIDLNDIESIEIEIHGIEKDGREYILVEASGEAACKYRNAMFERMQFGEKGKVSSMKNMADTEPLLVSLCLFEVGHEGKRTPVSLQKVKSWKNRTQKRLFEMAQKISDLVEEGGDTHVSLVAALSREDSPYKLAEFVSWVEGLEGDTYTPLKKLVELTPEERAKNSLADTTAG